MIVLRNRPKLDPYRRLLRRRPNVWQMECPMTTATKPKPKKKAKAAAADKKQGPIQGFEDLKPKAPKAVQDAADEYVAKLQGEE